MSLVWVESMFIVHQGPGAEETGDTDDIWSHKWGISYGGGTARYYDGVWINILSELLPQWDVLTTAERGVDIDNMEAMAFAWLAYRTLHNRPGNLPEVTGASQPARLGAIYPAS